MAWQLNSLIACALRQFLDAGATKTREETGYFQSFSHGVFSLPFFLPFFKTAVPRDESPGSCLLASCALRTSDKLHVYVQSNDLKVNNISINVSTCTRRVFVPHFHTRFVFPSTRRSIESHFGQVTVESHFGQVVVSSITLDPIVTESWRNCWRVFKVSFPKTRMTMICNRLITW